jgi:hypothetical protein
MRDRVDASRVKKSSNCPESSPPEDVQGYSTTPVESLQIVTPPLDLQIAIKAMKIQQDKDSNKYDEILFREENWKSS